MAPVSPSAPPQLTPAEEYSAAVRIERLFSIFVGTGFFAYLALLAPQIVTQSALTASWWNLSAPLLVFGPPAVLVIAAIARRPVLSRWASRSCAATFVIVALSWFPAWTGEVSDDGLWFTMFPGLAGLAAAITMRPAWTLAVTAAATLPAQAAGALVRPDGDPAIVTANVMFAFGFILPYVCAAMMAIRTGRVLDATRADAYAGAAAAAEADARRSQRSHVDGLLHDWVISTLLAAARQGNTEAVRRQATTTLDKLDSPPPEISTLSATEARTRLRAAVLDVDITQQVTSTIDDAAARLRVPVEVVDVLDAASAEAVRNSILHAGDDATRTVALNITSRAIDVSIVDDGRGFDPAAVPPHRLGLAVSIRSRVRALPGGSAVVSSAVGAGTRVHLRWEQPA